MANDLVAKNQFCSGTEHRKRIIYSKKDQCNIRGLWGISN